MCEYTNKPIHKLAMCGTSESMAISYMIILTEVLFHHLMKT